MNDKQKYYNYLKSEKWKQIRQLVAKRDNFKCTRCGKHCTDTENLKGFNIHHKTYLNIYNEKDNLDDLRFLCRKCHNSITLRLNKHKKAIIEINNEVLRNKKVILNTKCVKCGNNKFFIKEFRKNTGLYCYNCKKWHKFLNKKEREKYI